MKGICPAHREWYTKYGEVCERQALLNPANITDTSRSSAWMSSFTTFRSSNDILLAVCKRRTWNAEWEPGPMAARLILNEESGLHPCRKEAGRRFASLKCSLQSAQHCRSFLEITWIRLFHHSGPIQYSIMITSSHNCYTWVVSDLVAGGNAERSNSNNAFSGH